MSVDVKDLAKVLASLKLDGNINLVGQVASQLANSPVNPSSRKIKLTLVGDGTDLYIKTTPFLGGFSISPVIVGKGKYTKKGSGELWATHLPVGLSGVYRLSLGPQTTKLYNGDDEHVWVWQGEQTGLDGDVEIEIGTLYGLAKWVHEYGGYLV